MSEPTWPFGPDEWARRLYGRLPGTVRAGDLDVARRVSPAAGDAEILTFAPLFGLVRAIADGVAALEQDMHDLWDDFFIETCADWVVPYLAQLVGTTLPVHPITRSARVEVRSTLDWRRSRGTPAMLADVAAASSGWGCDLAEAFRQMAATQRLDHPRPDRTLTPDLRDRAALAALGTAHDPLAHLTDVRPAAVLDAPRLTDPGNGRSTPLPAWGSPGRYNLSTLQFQVRPFQTFAVTGATPARLPGREPDTAGFTFDPLGRDIPLWSRTGPAAIARAAMAREPQRYWADSGPADLCVRRSGIPLATVPRPGPPTASPAPFTFGAPDPGVRLADDGGLQILEPRRFARLNAHFLITARWVTDTEITRLGALSTLGLPAGSPRYAVDRPLGAAGRLVIRVETGRPDDSLGWGDLPVSTAGRFPGGVVAVRDDRRPVAARGPGGARVTDSSFENALLVYLPEAFLSPGQERDFDVAQDGATYRAQSPAAAALDHSVLARAGEGQVWPPADLASPSTSASAPAVGVHRSLGLQVPDPTPFGGLTLALDLFLVGGTQQLLGGLGTVDRAVTDGLRRDYALEGDTWPAFGFRPSAEAVLDRIPVGGTGCLAVRVRPTDAGVLAGGPVTSPQAEAVVMDRSGNGLLVYLPEVDLDQTAPEFWLIVADDGSTYQAGPAPTQDSPGRLPAGATLARAGAGQVLPREGAIPLRRRTVVAGRPLTGELGVDPERGRFCLGPEDPLLAAPADTLTVDYREAFPAPTGARTYARPGTAGGRGASRVVSASGDAATDLPYWRIHRTITGALSAATPDDVIAVADSRTYREAPTVDVAALGNLALVAAQTPAVQRPCLVADGPGVALHLSGPSSTRAGPAVSATVEGLLVGGDVEVDGVLDLALAALSLVPASGGAGALRLAGRGQVTIALCTSGPVRSGRDRALHVCDSVLDARLGRDDLALRGPEEAERAGEVHLERATLLGRLRCTRLVASETLLCARAEVADQQTGCVRFSRFEPGSTVPRRYRCLPRSPGDDGYRPPVDPARPAFRSLDPSRPDYAFLSAASAAALLTAGRTGGEIGAFATAERTARVGNMRARLDEFMPVGLSPVILATWGDA